MSSEVIELNTPAVSSEVIELNTPAVSEIIELNTQFDRRSAFGGYYSKPPGYLFALQF